MKRFLYLLLAASMLFAYGCTGDTTTITTPTGSDTVSGTLRDPATNAPIAGAVIKNGLNTAVTDSTGNWTLGGFSETTAVTLSVAPQFMVTISKLPAGYPTQVFRTVGASQSILGPNDLTVGKLNATVTGQILNSDGSPAVGAQVFITYLTDGHSGTLSLSAIGTAYSNSITALTDATGRYSIGGVETGSIIFPTARSADGLYTRGLVYAAAGVAPMNLRQLSLIDNFTTNLTTEYFAATPDTDQPLQALAPTVNGNAVVNNGEIVSGPVVVEFPLNKPIDQTAYTSSTTIYNDAFVGVVSKAGNVAFTITYKLVDPTDLTSDITAIDVNFTTAASAIYTVNLGDATGAATTVQLGSFLNKIGVAAGETAQKFVFSTDSGTVPAGAPVLARPAVTVVPALSNDLTFTWSPIAGAIGYNVYAQRIENGVTFPLVKVAFLNSGVIATYALNPLDVGGPVNNAQLAFADGINQVTYKAELHPLGSDKVEIASVNSAPITLTDRYAPYVVAVANRPANVAAIAIGGSESNVVATPATFTFSEQMDKASVETAANWAPVFLPALAATTVPAFTKSITYDQGTLTATMTWTLSNGATATTAIPAGTQVFFTGTFKDLSLNNTIIPIAPLTSW